MFETRVLPFPRIEQAYTVERDKDGFMEFELIEDGKFKLESYDFYDAFQLLFSNEMLEFIKLANKRNEFNSDYRELYNQTSQLMRDGNSITEQTLYDITVKAKFYGILSGRCEEMKNAIIDRTSWLTWINASKLYEVFTGTYREWLN